MKKLDTTRKIFVGSIIRAYKKGFGYSTLTVIENSDYYMAALAGEEFFIATRDGDAVEAYLWVEDVASYEFTLKVIGRIVTGQPIMFFDHTDAVSRNSERKCLTAQVDIPIQFFTFDPGEANRGVSSEEIVFNSGSVILLSDREATIKSGIDLSGSKFLKGSIRIGKETVELIGKIETINKSKMIYNVLFAGMHDRVRNLILEYIFSTYRE